MKGSKNSETNKKRVNAHTRIGKRPRKKLGNLLKEAHSQNKFMIGNVELNKLWNRSTGNLESCRSKERDFLPSLESYFEEAIEQSDPAAMVDDEYKRVNDSNFGWRALRLLARRSPHFFTHSNNPINKLPDYLEMMIKKIAKDKPLPIAGVDIKQDQPETKEGVEEMIVNEPDAEDEDLLKASEDKREDGRRTEEENLKLLKSFMDDLSELIPIGGWKKLGVKLGYQQSEIEYFEGMKPIGRKTSKSESNADSTASNNSCQEGIKTMLKFCCDMDDANIENLIYTLEGLEMLGGVNYLKQYLSNNSE